MEHEFFEPREKQPIEPMLISDGIERYYEAYGTNPIYETVSSSVIEGHEVAWMKYTGTIVQDIMELGREGQSYEGYCFKCACNFNEGVGWFFDEEYGAPVSTDADRDCEARAIASKSRQEELKNEYLMRGYLDKLEEDEIGTIKTIILDLIEKSTNNEFLETYTGASFWGGHYYLQLVESVTGIDMYKLYQITDQLEKEKVISMNGAVICEYHEPSPPRWEPFGTLESSGWKVTICMPTHEKMNQTWKFEVYNPDGELIELDIPELPMMYAPIFGPDADDVANAEQTAQQILMQIINENKG